MKVLPEHLDRQVGEASTEGQDNLGFMAEVIEGCLKKISLGYPFQGI